MVAKNWNKTSFKVQFSCFVTKPEEFGAINMYMCALLWTKFLAVAEIHISSTTSISCVLQSSWMVQRNKTCSTHVSLSVPHAHIEDSATPVLKASAINIVSCSRIPQYATPTSPTSRFWVKESWYSLLGSTHMYTFLYCHNPTFVAIRGVATFSALGGRAMIWGAYDSK